MHIIKATHISKLTSYKNVVKASSDKSSEYLVVVNYLFLCKSTKCM